MSLYLDRIEELPGVGRLGRHVEHDPRSLAYLEPERDTPLQSKTWPRHIGSLDQQDTGACTGFGATGCLGSDPFFPTITITLDNAEGRELYHEATILDSISGTWPPTDTGSTGLAVAKACKNAGLISGYTHATSLQAALSTIANASPVITGVNWYEGFDTPDENGLVHIEGDVRGGHEFVVRGVDVENQLVHADNSWGATWGLAGSFSFSWDDWERLLGEEGDVTVFTPNTQPAPTPTPTPTPPAPSSDAALKKLVKAHGRYDAAFQAFVDAQP